MYEYQTSEEIPYYLPGTEFNFLLDCDPITRSILLLSSAKLFCIFYTSSALKSSAHPR